MPPALRQRFDSSGGLCLTPLATWLRISGIALTCAALASPPPIAAQGIGFAPHLGTLGLGMDVGVGIGPVDIRAGYHNWPSGIETTQSGIAYEMSIGPDYSLLADIGGRNARVTLGLLYSPSHIEGTATPVSSQQIGSTTYTAAEIGTLRSSLINNDFAPYIGVGAGRMGRPGTRWGWFLDLGVAFHGAPSVDLTADGTLAAQPAFLANLEAERADLESSVSDFKVYPVLKFGIFVRIDS